MLADARVGGSNGHTAGTGATCVISGVVVAGNSCATSLGDSRRETDSNSEKGNVRYARDCVREYRKYVAYCKRTANLGLLDQWLAPELSCRSEKKRVSHCNEKKELQNDD